MIFLFRYIHMADQLILSFGTAVVINIQNRIDFLIVTEGEQILELNQLSSFGIINIYDKSTFTLKSMNRFRAAFEPIAGYILVYN